jgi:hypothetical protein
VIHRRAKNAGAIRQLQAVSATERLRDKSKDERGENQMNVEFMISARRASIASLVVARACLAIAGLSAVFFATTIAAQTPDVHQDKPRTYYMIIFTNPAPGQEDEYNKWYDAHHATDVVANPGFVSAQRLVSSELQVQDVKTPRQYGIVYTIVTDDLLAVHNENTRRLKAGIIPVEPVLDLPSTISYTYKAIAPPIEHKDSAGAASHAGLQTYYLLAFSSPIPAEADRFSKWFDDTKTLSDIVAAPGFLNGQQVALLPPVPNASAISRPNTSTRYTEPKLQYPRMVMFRIATSNLTPVLDAFNQHAPPQGTSFIYVFKTHGPLIDGDKIRAQCAGITTAPCP